MKILDRSFGWIRRAHRQDPGVFPAKQVHVFLHLGPGTDQGHVSGNDIDQLWQFVQLVTAKEGAQTGDALIAAGGHTGPVEMGIVPHRTVLVDAEDLAVQPHALLAEEYRARAGQFDGDGDDGEKRGEEDQTDPRPQDINNPFQHGISVLPRSLFPKSVSGIG